MVFLGASDGKESACNAGDLDLILGLGRFLGGGNGNPLWYYSLENPQGPRSLAGCSPWGLRVRQLSSWAQYNAYIWNLERWYWWTYFQGSSGDADIQRDMGHSGGRRGWDELESSMEAYALLTVYGEWCRIHDLWRRFSFGTREQAWSLKSFCIARFY